MAFLSFLREQKLEEVTKKTSTRGTSKQWNPAPDFLGFRIWKDGSVFPSQKLVEMFNLEYPAVTITKETIPVKEGSPEGTEPTIKRTYEYPNGTGNGFDCIDSRLWGQCLSLIPEGGKHFIAIAPVQKGLPKVNIFSSTKYEEDGTPTKSVMEQGSTTFGATTLLPTIKEIYNVEPCEEGYIDLLVDTSFNLKEICPNGVFLFPKTTSRGDDKGKADYERRENVDVFALVPVQLLTEVIEDASNASGNSENTLSPVSEEDKASQ